MQEVLEAMEDGSELTEWVAFFELEEEREDDRAGQVAAAVLNAAGAKRKGGGRWQPWDFFPSLKPRTDVPEQGLEQQVEAVRGLAGLFGGRFTPGSAEA